MSSLSCRCACRIFVTALLSSLLPHLTINVASAAVEEQCTISDTGEKVCDAAAAAAKPVPCVDKHEVRIKEIFLTLGE